MSYYKESGKFNILYTLLVLALVIPAIGGLAYGYSILTHLNPFIYINFFLTIGFMGAIVGGTYLVVLGGQIRNFKLVLLIAILLSAFGLYAVWVGYVAYLFDESFAFAAENLQWGIERLSNQTFTIGRGASGPEMTGIWLYLFWGIEAGVILLVPIIGVYKFIKNATLYCEECQRWAKGEYKIRKKSDKAITKDDLETLLQGKGLDEIMELENVAANYTNYYEFTFTSCEKCCSRFYLSLEHVSNTIDSKGKEEENRIGILPFYELDARLVPENVRASVELSKQH
jgi:hypothetical protein